MPNNTMTPNRPTAYRASLRVAVGGQLRVDKESGIIVGAAIMTIGEARGHGFTIDQQTLLQAQQIIRAAGSVKVRISHPTPGADKVFTQVGRIENPHIDGNVLRGDVHIGEYADSLPGLAGTRKYLLGVAEDDPASIGLSADIIYRREKGAGVLPVARLVSLNAVDFVASAAANSNGLLSTPKEFPMSQTNYQTHDQLDDNTGAPALDENAKLEIKRVESIKALAACAPKGSLPEDFATNAIAANLSVPDANKVMLTAISNNCKPIRGVATMSIGEDQQRAMLAQAIPDALAMRGGGKVDKPHELATTKYMKMRGVDIFRSFLSGAGVPDVLSITPSKIADYVCNPLAFQRDYPTQHAQLAQSSGSFSYLTADAMGKSLRKAYMDTPVSWPMWCGRDTAPDFKARKFVSLSDAPALVAKPEGAEIKYGTLSDGQETATLVTYASGLRVTREAIINDDLRAFGKIPMFQGGAAKRLEDDVAFAILTANAALADTVALFHGTHANLVSATAGLGAPTVTTMTQSELLMIKQTGPNGAYLKLFPKFLIVPIALRSAANQLINSVVDPSKSNAAVNPYANLVQVIADPRLDASSATVWYLAADPATIETIMMVFLDDEPEPVLEQETAFDTKDVKFAVRHTIVGKAIDYRGLVKNPGA